MKIDRTQVVAEICNRMDALHLRHAIVFNPKTLPAVPPFVPLAEALAEGLALGHERAVHIARALVDYGDQQDPRFWALDFGRLLFTAGGFPRETCTQAVAAAVLGCSRQWVSAMVAEEKLTSADDRGVYVEQVRQVLKSRANRLLIDEIVK